MQQTGNINSGLETRPKLQQCTRDFQARTALLVAKNYGYNFSHKATARSSRKTMKERDSKIKERKRERESKSDGNS